MVVAIAYLPAEHLVADDQARGRVDHPLVPFGSHCAGGEGGGQSRRRVVQVIR